VINSQLDVLLLVPMRTDPDVFAFVLLLRLVVRRNCYSIAERESITSMRQRHLLGLFVEASWYGRVRCCFDALLKSVVERVHVIDTADLRTAHAQSKSLSEFQSHLRRDQRTCFRQHTIMAPSNLPASFNATSHDVEMLLAAQCHIGAKNVQVHMEPYVWKRRPDGVSVINIGKTWYVKQ